MTPYWSHISDVKPGIVYLEQVEFDDFEVEEFIAYSYIDEVKNGRAMGRELHALRLSNGKWEFNGLYFDRRANRDGVLDLCSGMNCNIGPKFKSLGSGISWLTSDAL